MINYSKTHFIKVRHKLYIPIKEFMCLISVEHLETILFLYHCWGSASCLKRTTFFQFPIS